MQRGRGETLTCCKDIRGQTQSEERCYPRRDLARKDIVGPSDSRDCDGNSVGYDYVRVVSVISILFILILKGETSVLAVPIRRVNGRTAIHHFLLYTT